MAKAKKRKRRAAASPHAGGRGDSGLTELYRELGYVGDLSSARAPGRRARLAAESPQWGDAGPLTPARLRELEKEFKRDPQGVLKVVSKSLAYPMTEIEFRKLLAKGRQAMDQPRQYAAMLRQRRRLIEDPCKPPSYIPKYPDIEVKPCSIRYEGANDALGWLVNCGSYWTKQKLGKLKCAELLRHSDFPSRFVYPMKAQNGAALGAGDTIRIALFSDFATGEYQSLYVAKKILETTPAPHYAIHLGDVYYAGTAPEVKKYLEEPMRPILDRSRVFVMNANHEMLSGGFAYFRYLEDKRAGGAHVEQEQEGSYFCLTSPGYQLIAIDTAHDYRKNGELADPVQFAWLSERLREGRAANRKSILLTQHEPFGIGELGANALLEQVKGCAERNSAWPLDYWFWGDEHYCVLFEKSERVPFVGSCIGHGGHPVDLREVGRRTNVAAAFAKECWVDASPRFKTFRTDELGNTGYCMLELGPVGVKLSYRNWLGDEVRAFNF